MMIRTFVITAALLLTFNTHAEKAAVSKPKYLIKWQMAHYPIRYFKQTAEAFRQEVYSKSNGDIDVAITVLDVNPTDRKEFFNNAVEKVHAGEYTMAQVYTHDLAVQKPSLYLFSLPFLFDNHEHMAAVMEAPEVGGKLLASLSDLGLKGLGFTYSGGQLVVLSQSTEIRRLEDFKNLQYRRLDNPVWIETLNTLGAQHFPQNLRRHGKRLSLTDSFAQGIAEAADSTYADADVLMFDNPKKRPLANVLNETGHAYLTTALIMNQKFFAGLPAEYQNIVQQAAANAARFERKIVIEDEAKVRKMVAQKFKIVTMDPAEMQRFKDATKTVIQKFESSIGRDLIDKARALKGKGTKLARHE